MKLVLGLVAGVSLGLAGPVLSQAPAEPPIGALRPVNLPQIERIKLPNGMTLALVPFGSVPQVRIVLSTFAGDIDSGGHPWLAGINADLMKQGAGGKDARQLAEAFSAIGGELQASADSNTTQVSATALSDHAADAIALVADVVRKPNMLEADFSRVKANRKRALSQALASPQTMADVLLARALYGAHPYGSPIPTAAQLDATTLADVRGFHDSQFGAARSTLYVIGQFDPALVRAIVRKSFGDWNRGPLRKKLPASFTSGPRLILADRAGSEQTTVRVAFDAPAVGSAQDIPLRAADALLAGSFGSRITANIRENKGYTYSPYSNIAGRPGGATWSWNADITPSVTGAAMAEVFKEIRRLQGEPPAISEAQGMKTYTATYVLMRMTSADLIAAQLVRADVLGLSPDYFSNYVQRAMAVSPQQMSASVKARLPLERLVMVAVGDMKTVEPQLLGLPELRGAKVERVALTKP